MQEKIEELKKKLESYRKIDDFDEYEFKDKQVVTMQIVKEAIDIEIEALKNGDYETVRNCNTVFEAAYLNFPETREPSWNNDVRGYITKYINEKLGQDYKEINVENNKQIMEEYNKTKLEPEEDVSSKEKVGKDENTITNTNSTNVENNKQIMEKHNKTKLDSKETVDTTTNTNNTNKEKVEINFEDLNKRINNFENIDKLKGLDISAENFEELKDEIIEEELAVLESIGEDLHEMKEKIEAEEKRLEQRTEELPKEIEEATTREAQIKEELEKLEEEFNNLSEDDPDYASKESALKEKGEELKEASSTLGSLKSEQENLKTDYEKLNEDKARYMDSFETYQNRIDISFDVINKFNPEKAQQISNIQKTEQLEQTEQQQNKNDQKKNRMA